VINMPLVRTPMVEPTRMYQRFPLISPDKAAGMVCDAVIGRPERLATPLGTLARFVELIAPRINTAIMAETFRMFPESEAAGGAAGSDRIMTQDMMALASLLQGIHS